MQGDQQSHKADIYAYSHATTEGIMAFLGTISWLGGNIDDAFGLDPDWLSLSFYSLAITAPFGLYASYGAFTCHLMTDRANKSTVSLVSEDAQAGTLSLKEKIAVRGGQLADIGGFTGSILAFAKTLFPGISLTARLVTQLLATILGTLSAIGEARTTRNSMLKLKGYAVDDTEHADLYTRSHGATEGILSLLGTSSWAGANFDDACKFNPEWIGLSRYGIAFGSTVAVLAACGVATCHSITDQANKNTDSRNTETVPLTTKNKFAIAGGVVSHFGSFTGTALAFAKSLYPSMPKWASLVTQFSGMAISAPSAFSEARTAMNSMLKMNGIFAQRNRALPLDERLTPLLSDESQQDDSVPDVNPALSIV